MIKLPPEKRSITRNGEVRNEFKKIRGIGRVKQQWLRECFNIHTVRELAELSLDEVESCLQAEEQSFSKSEIEGWIIQAREIVALEEPQQAAESPENLASSQEDETWTTLASFVVEFQCQQNEEKVKKTQIIVRHPAANPDQTECRIENERLRQWIAHQLSEVNPQAARRSYDSSVGVRTVSSEASITAIPSFRLTSSANSSDATTSHSTNGATARSPEAASLVKVEIEQIHIWQPTQTQVPMVVEKANRLFPCIMRTDQPFELEVGFRLAELSLTHILKGEIGCLVQCYMRDRKMRTMTPLGEIETSLDTFAESQLFYKLMLPETTLKQPGLYRLQVLVTLRDVPATSGYFELPLLQVV